MEFLEILIIGCWKTKMETRKDAVTIRLNSVSEEEDRDDSWLPAESPSSPPQSEPLKNTDNLNETTLKFCFVEGQYFLAEGNRWVPVEKEKRLKTKQGWITVALETVNQRVSPKERQSRTPSDSLNVLGITSNLTDSSVDTILSQFSNDDPLGFLEKGLRWNSPVVNDEE